MPRDSARKSITSRPSRGSPRGAAEEPASGRVQGGAVGWTFTLYCRSPLTLHSVHSTPASSNFLAIAFTYCVWNSA